MGHCSARPNLTIVKFHHRVLGDRRAVQSGRSTFCVLVEGHARQESDQGQLATAGAAEGNDDFVEPNRVLGVHVAVNERAATTSRAASGARVHTSFDAFYQQEFPQAARFAWFLVRSAAAEDLAQEAFVALCPRWEEIDNPRGFVNRVVVNRSRSWRRDERRHRAKAARFEYDQKSLSSADADLFDVIIALPYRQRLVVVTRYWLGWSEAEIADALGCRPGTVKSLASRALTRLRREIAP